MQHRCPCVHQLLHPLAVANSSGDIDRERVTEEEEEEEEEEIGEEEEENMVEMMTRKETSHCWWFDSHHTSSGSPWLQSTLAELDKKTKAMLELIEANADSFAQRAEMYYEKRPELISMVEDFYRAHRSLAERHDQLKSDSGNRLLTTLGSPFSNNYRAGKSMSVVTDQTYDSQSETCDPEDAAESEIEDPEEDQIQVDEEMEEIESPERKKETQGREVEVSSALCNIEMKKLREEIQRLKQENMIYKDHLLLKDEEKREQKKETQLNEGLGEVEVSRIVCNIEVMELKEEIERLKQENLIYKGCLLQKNEAMREFKKETRVKEGSRDFEVSRVPCNIKSMELKEEIEELKEENMIYKDHLLQKDEETREQKKETRVNEVTSDLKVAEVVCNIEAMELKEIEKLKEENVIYKDQLLQKDEEMREQKKETRAIGGTRDVEVSSALFNDEVKKLRVEIARLKEGNMVHEDLLLQKDEEKREVIRQLSLAVEVIKLENMKLRKYVARESSKKRSHSTLEKMKDLIMAKFSNGGSSKSQGSAVVL